uniref:hypothetical protein n=1 Tax=Marinobacter changyiensis TaxID=2604091 RepID=UPI001FE785B1
MILKFAWRGRNLYRLARFSLLRKSYLAFILSLFSLFLPSVSYAEALVNGGFVTGAISTPGEEDSFNFTVDAGQYVNLSVADIDNTSLAPRIRLFAPDGEFLTNGSGSTVGRIRNFQVPQTGTYTVLVDDVTQGGAQTGNYELHFASAPGADEHGALINGGLRTEVISTGDLDTYTFAVEAGQYVNLSVSDIDETSLAPQIWLYSPDGSYLTKGLGSTVGRIRNFQVPQTGTYTVLVDDVTQGGAQTGNYELHFA